jgi:hypothetical protein
MTQMLQNEPSCQHTHRAVASYGSSMVAQLVTIWMVIRKVVRCPEVQRAAWHDTLKAARLADGCS